MSELAGRDTLLDTGPLVAALVRRDQWHEPLAPLWRQEITRCLTTEPVLVEATHIVHGYGFNPARVLEFVIAARIPVFAIHLPLHAECVHLLRRFANLPMDYADATLVALADRLRLTRVFTVDRKGFRAYRGARGVPLELVG